MEDVATPTPAQPGLARRESHDTVPMAMDMSTEMINKLTLLDKWVATFGLELIV
jgi:hypothetical protein